MKLCEVYVCTSGGKLDMSGRFISCKTIRWAEEDGVVALIDAILVPSHKNTGLTSVAQLFREVRHSRCSQQKIRNKLY